MIQPAITANDVALEGLVFGNEDLRVEFNPRNVQRHFMAKGKEAASYGAEPLPVIVFDLQAELFADLARED